VPSALLIVLAQASSGGGSEGFPLGQTLIYVGIIFGLLWLFLIRPQQQQQVQERELLSGIKKNDKVVTKCGMLGVVTNVKDNEVTLKIDEQNNVKVRFRKDAIAGKVEDKKKENEPSK